LVLAGPSLFGINGQLDPVSLPREWGAARAAIDRQSGTVLALPWHEYLQLGVADNRNVFNPVSIYFGGDVLSSSDPEFLSGPEQEQADPREPAARRVLARIRAGQPAGTQLAQLGVRWVVVLRAADWQSYTSLTSDPGVRRVVGGSTLDLYQVRGWRGPVVTQSGRVVPLRGVAGPFGWLAASGPATWFRPAATGWMRGLSAAHFEPNGTLGLPAGRGPVWYWPTLVVLAADVTTVVVVVCVVARRRRTPRHPQRARGADNPAKNLSDFVDTSTVKRLWVGQGE
jgi:hypothetical protein